MTSDNEFKSQLIQMIIKQCNYAIPWPPETLHDQIQYLAFAGKYLCPDYHFKQPQIEWLHSEAIKKLCQIYPEEYSWQMYNLDRRWNIIQLLRLIGDVKGDTVECGAFEGAGSLCIIVNTPRSPDGKKRMHYIFDSFEGVSEPGQYDDHVHFHKGTLAAGEDIVAKRLNGFLENCRFYKGWIPSRFNEVQESNFAFVHIDVDLYEPTRDSIKFFYPRINAGGILVCDDYGFSTTPGATKAINEFLADKPEKMLAFASGGGWIMKGQKVAICMDNGE